MRRRKREHLIPAVTSFCTRRTTGRSDLGLLKLHVFTMCVSLGELGVDDRVGARTRPCVVVHDEDPIKNTREG